MKMGYRRYARTTVLWLAIAALCGNTACGTEQSTSLPVQTNRTEETETNRTGETGTDRAGEAETERAGETGTVRQEEPSFTAQELIRADFLLYNVDCASADTNVFPEGEPCGLYQSVSDQPYGEDGGSGMQWGYHPEDYLIREADKLGEGFLAAKWTMAEELYAGGEETAVRYNFQLPEGEYLVTVGFYNPFGPRKIDVDCEGVRAVEAEKLLRYRLTEKQFTARVEDGELNLQVFNSSGKRAMDIPVLSYIRIAVIPEYTKELLELALAEYVPTKEADDYKAESYERYSRAVAQAEEILQRDAPTTAECEEKFKQLKEECELIVERYRYDSFQPGRQWRDTENEIIQAHGGQVQRLVIPDEETGEPVSRWIWVGEDKTQGSRGGIRAYSSEDLYNWRCEGIILRNVDSREALDEDEYFREVYAGYTDEQLDNVYRSLDAESAIIERPKLIYNEKTGQYVLWFHADGPTQESASSYAAACAGVAVSDSPFGPYRFIDRYRLNVCPRDQEDQHPSSRGMARDMNLFADADGTAYIIYSSEENLTLYISKLNEEYTYLATPPERAVYGKDFIRLFPGAQREAPALFEKDGVYYLLTSGCTGWDPNRARYYTSDSLLGEWTDMGDPCVGDERGTTFDSQSTCVFEDGSGRLIYMGDRWNSDNLSDSRYIWLPIEFPTQGRMELRWQDEWK